MKNIECNATCLYFFFKAPFVTLKNRLHIDSNFNLSCGKQGEYRRSVIIRPCLRYSRGEGA